MNSIFRGLLPKREPEGRAKHFESLEGLVAGYREERFQRFAPEIRATCASVLVTLDGGIALPTPCESATPDEGTGTCNRALPLHS